MSQEKDWEAQIAAWDTLVRQGQAKTVEKELHKYLPSEIPRRYARSVAAIARRINHIGFGIRLLNGIVRPSRKAPATATPQEKTEYAACLTRIGALEEAANLLKEVPESAVPEVLFYRSFIFAAQWNYAAIIPALRKFLTFPEVDPYLKLVSKLNLTASLAFEKEFEEAEKYLKEIIAEAESKHLSLILGNALELSANVFISEKDWTRAQTALNRAHELLKNSAPSNHLFVDKWQAILQLYKNGANEETLTQLFTVREKAVTLSHWETIRDCDKYFAISTKDIPTLLKVYFGTPHEKYRARLLKDFPAAPKLPEMFDWELGDTKSKTTYYLDLETGKQGENICLEPGQLLHRILVALSLDHYRPLRVASIHHFLYPDEFYNPDSSSNKVRQVIDRFRKWANENDCPIQIKEHREWYYLSSEKKVILHSPINPKPISREVFQLLSLESKLKEKSFNAKEVAKILTLSPRSALRVIQTGMEQGKLQKEGKGPSTKYRFAA